MTPAFWWLALLVVVLIALIVPTVLYERWLGSDYREYLERKRAAEAWRDRIVGGPKLPHHRSFTPRVVRRGQVR